MKAWKFVALFCAMLLSGNVLFAQGKVTGKVIDSKSGSAVEYATVALLRPADSSLVNGSVTSSNGSFSVSVAYGKYLLRVSFMGYNTYYHTSTITLSQSNPTLNVGKIKISPAATMMDEVVITAERSMVEYQLDKRVINVDKNIVTGGGTATDILETVPSVAIDNDGNVTLRGSTNVKVLINGRPYELLSSDLESLLEQIPASTVENVEVITNPSAKYDPEGMSGIINLKLKEKTAGALGLNGVANLNVGTPLAFLFPSYPREFMPAIIPTAMGSINLNYTTEKYNLFFNADAGVRSHGHLGHTDVERMFNGVATSHDSMDNYSVGSNYMGSLKFGGEYYINDKNTILLSYQLRGGKRMHGSLIDSWDILYPDDSMSYRQTDTSSNFSLNHSFNLNYTKKFEEKDRLLTFDATFSMRHRDGDGDQIQNYLFNDIANWHNYYERESETHNQHKSLNVQLNYVHPFAKNWRLEAGYEGRGMWADQNSIYNRTEYDPATGILMDPYFDATSSTHYFHRQQVHAIYATVGGKIVEGLTAQAGLRGEYSNVYGYDVNHPASDTVNKTYWQPYPTLHLSYEINKDQSIQLSYSRRVRRPQMWDLNPYMDVREGMQLSFGNPSIDPEFTNAIELSYNIGFKTVNIFTSAYYRQTNNMMTRYGFVWDASSAARYSWWMPYNPEYDGYWASTWQNLNTGTNYGLEVIFDWQVFKWWKLNLSVNLFESTIEGTELLNNEDKQAFRTSGKFSSFMNLPKDWTIQLSGQYRAPFMDLQTEMWPSYWVDLAVKKDVLQKRGTINIRIGDVFRTGGFGHETYNEQMNRVMSSRRISPTVSVGFSYKINNGLKQSRKPNMEEEDGGEDYGM